MRTTLDNLIAAEQQLIQIKPHNSNAALTPDQAQQQTLRENSRKAAQTKALDVAASLHQEAGLMAQQQTLYSSGFPISQQRGQLYERWAKHLENILADNNAKTPRLLRLMAFRDKLDPQQHSVLRKPIKHHSPTLRALFRSTAPAKTSAPTPTQANH